MELHIPVSHSADKCIVCLPLDVLLGQPDKAPVGQLPDSSANSCTCSLLIYDLAFSWEWSKENLSERRLTGTQEMGGDHTRKKTPVPSPLPPHYTLSLLARG
jgi:hypothetical protein